MFSISYLVVNKIEKIIQKIKWDNYRSFFKYCGNNVIIDPTCTILVPDNFSIGHNSSISAYTVIYSAYGVEIGNNCLISSNCGISSINHIINSANRVNDPKDIGQHCKPVKIGNNVWIGMNACILPGITIGDNSIIGSGSVVSKNVPSNEIWVGNPARKIKEVII
ncbi:acyltransferase [Parasediminibacterium sp. JCM 36343]|uniref:acyltransferase n=1 Tax=Parasediminibacterium sp. JCM 36343 TaxID=3374279 RepID=UPI00397B5FF1